MKQILAYDKNAKQFKTDVAGKRFYLGGNATEAKDRKRKIVAYRATLPAWDDNAVEIAKAIAKGEKYTVPTTGDEHADEARRIKLTKAGVPVTPTATMEDYHAAEAEILRERIAELEDQLKRYAGPRVVVSKMSITTEDGITFTRWKYAGGTSAFERRYRMSNGNILAAAMNHLKAKLLKSGIDEPTAVDIAFDLVELRDECERTQELILKLEQDAGPPTSDEWVVLNSHLSHLCEHSSKAAKEIEKIW